MNLILDKYKNEYEKVLIDYIIDFFYWHSGLNRVEAKPCKNMAKQNLLRWLDKNHELYVITMDASAVGFVHIWYKGENVAWIEDIYVEKSKRRKGIGSYAIKEVENIISQRDGYTSVCIDVVPKNKNALDLYYELGYDTLSLITIRKELQENNRKPTAEFLGRKFKI